MICKNLGFIVKNAFTLAEVLITLIIIGVISALTVPNLVVKYHKKMTAMQVQKAYSELNQVLNRAIAAHGEPSNWDYYGESELSDWVKKYIVIVIKSPFFKFLQQTLAQFVSSIRSGCMFIYVEMHVFDFLRFE